MSGIEGPGTPPEVPEEFADAYRDAYERALADEDVAGPVRRQVPIWALFLLLVAVLIAAAFVVGKIVSGPSNSPGAASGGPTYAGPSSPAPHRNRTHRPAPSGAASGSFTPVTIDSAQATCTAPPGVDSAGHPVDYQVANAIDGKSDTAWRCDGSAIGETLTLTLPAGTSVTELGVIPGYAKTDPTSGTDRYAENNRITRIRWTLADGVVVTQNLNPDPTDRALQTIRTPATVTGTVTLQILKVAKGSRDTTAISEIQVGEGS
ncbi:MAG: hypothetical protein JWP74_2969 [Marmoricola sp.]|nr:hypothetical protein [Marmoricola sp.]